jgi:hypothetical protein
MSQQPYLKVVLGLQVELNGNAARFVAFENCRTCNVAQLDKARCLRSSARTQLFCNHATDPKEWSSGRMPEMASAGKT